LLGKIQIKRQSAVKEKKKRLNQKTKGKDEHLENTLYCGQNGGEEALKGGPDRSQKRSFNNLSDQTGEG